MKAKRQSTASYIADWNRAVERQALQAYAASYNFESDDLRAQVLVAKSEKQASEQTRGIVESLNSINQESASC